MPQESAASAGLSLQSREIPPSRWRWHVCGLLFLATVLNYLDRQTLSLCAPLITQEFQLRDEEYGRMLSAFRWAYAALHVPAGYLADRFSVRTLYAGSVFFWSLAGAAAALARSSGFFTSTRAVLGIGEAFNWPCALRVTANILPPGERALGNGIFQSGTAIGALIAPLIIVPLAQFWGWRAAFCAVGGLGILWCMAWLWMTRIPGLSEAIDLPPASHRELNSFLVQLRKIFREPGFWLLLIAGGTINPCWYFLAEWLTKYLHDQREFSLLAAGLVTTPIFLGADMGNIAGGGFVKWLTGRGWRVGSARSLAVTIGALLVPTVIVAQQTQNSAVMICLLGTGAFGIAAIMSNWLACIQDVSFASVGLVMGLVGGFGCVVSATINPFIGRYVDETGHYQLIFILLGVLPLVTLCSILLFHAVNSHET